MSAIILGEDFQEAVLSMHRVAILSMLRELLDIEEIARFSAQQLEFSLLFVRNLFAMHHDFALSLPLALKHLHISCLHN